MVRISLHNQSFHIINPLLFVAPEQEKDGFNFAAWEAIGFGVPTLVSRSSGIAAVLEVNRVKSLRLEDTYAARHMKIRPPPLHVCLNISVARPSFNILSSVFLTK